MILAAALDIDSTWEEMREHPIPAGFSYVSNTNPEVVDNVNWSIDRDEQAFQKVLFCI